MNTFLAKFTRTGQQSKYLPNMTDYQGYLVQVCTRGVGTPVEKGGMNAYGEGETWEEYPQYEDYLKPFFDNSSIPDKTTRQFIEDNYARKTVQEVIAAGMEKYLLKAAGGADYTIENEDELRQKQVDEARLVHFQVHNCWETGLNWYQLSGRYPENVFNTMKPFLHYHDKEEEEEGNWKGWCLVGEKSKENIAKALRAIDWNVG